MQTLDGSASGVRVGCVLALCDGPQVVIVRGFVFPRITLAWRNIEPSQGDSGWGQPAVAL